MGADGVVLPSLTRSAPCSPCRRSLYRHRACFPRRRCRVPSSSFTTSAPCSPCCCSLCGSRGALVVVVMEMLAMAVRFLVKIKERKMGNNAPHGHSRSTSL